MVKKLEQIATEGMKGLEKIVAESITWTPTDALAEYSHTANLCAEHTKGAPGEIATGCGQGNRCDFQDCHNPADHKMWLMKKN